MRYSVHGFHAAALATLLFSAPARAEDAVRRLEADLTASPSATQFLTDRCAALKLASPPVIKAERAHETRAAGAEVRKWLNVGTDTVLGYRRVKLACGAHVLSEADNWYVPGRLTPEMNHVLDTSDTPFGAVVRPLNFHRNTLKMEALDEPAHALRVTAVLIAGDGKPFSLVVENYSRDLVTGDH
jgi:hypothetical protein